jgi:hypothetical protein
LLLQIHADAWQHLSENIRCNLNAIPKWKKKTPWSDSASELYRPSDRRLSAKLVLTFLDRGVELVPEAANSSGTQREGPSAVQSRY